MWQKPGRRYVRGEPASPPFAGSTQARSPVASGRRYGDFDLSPYLTPKEARKTDDFVHFGIAAAVQAIEESGLEITSENAARIGIAIGSGIGGLSGIEKGHLGYIKGGPRKISPFFVPANIINMIAGNLSIRYGIKGPNYGIVTACSTGTHNIGDAARMIERNDVRCHDRGRCGDGDLANGTRRILIRKGAVHEKRRARTSESPLGSRTRRIRARRRWRALLFSRNSNTQKRGAPRFTRSSQDSG